LEADLGLSKSELGLVDMALMLSYSGVQIVGSTLWDHTLPRRLIALCLTGTSLAMLAFGACNSLWAVCAALLASGAAQVRPGTILILNLSKGFD
jgi:sugar phosphate permease